MDNSLRCFSFALAALTAVLATGFGVLMSRDTLTGGQWEPLKRNPDVLRLRNLGRFE